MSQHLCPCQSGEPYSACCQPYHLGAAVAADESPAVLMRSRYSAFALGLVDYIQQSWHPDTRPAVALQGDGEASEQWMRLQVLSSQVDAEYGYVHFCATCRDQERWFVLEERSRFACKNGRWYYLDGKPQSHELKLGRNDRCPCGSGRKVKKCCL